jgi:hypothetical protein
MGVQWRLGRLKIGLLLYGTAELATVGGDGCRPKDVIVAVVVRQQINFKVWLTGANRGMTAVRRREKMPMYGGARKREQRAVSRTGVGEAYVPTAGSSNIMQAESVARTQARLARQ